MPEVQAAPLCARVARPPSAEGTKKVNLISASLTWLPKKAQHDLRQPWQRHERKDCTTTANSASQRL